MTYSKLLLLLVLGLVACGGTSTGDIVSGTPAPAGSGGGGQAAPGATPAGQGCDPLREDECAAGATCEAKTRTCVARRSCSDDSECPDWFVCEASATPGGVDYCRRSCGTSDDYCQDGASCSASGATASTCVAATTCDPNNGDDDCFGFVCNATTATCVAPPK